MASNEEYEKWGEVRCSGCESAVDLSSAESLTEAIELWNSHLERCES